MAIAEKRVELRSQTTNVATKDFTAIKDNKALNLAEKNITEVIIAKHRNGPVDTVKLYFQKEFTRFNNFTPRQ